MEDVVPEIVPEISLPGDHDQTIQIRKFLP
jgi:hypothetical protein